MLKKEILIPCYIIVLSIVFVIISALVIITKGRTSLLKKKLKIGAMIISLTAMVSGCGPGPQPMVLCYEMVLPDCFEISESKYVNDEDYVGEEISVDLSLNAILKGTIIYREAKEFSFIIADTKNTIKQRGEISPYDGEFDSETEKFEIAVDPEIPSGIYYLHLYNVAQDKQPARPEENPMWKFRLNITNKK